MAVLRHPPGKPGTLWDKCAFVRKEEIDRQMEFRIELAGVPIEITTQYEKTRRMCQDYLTGRQPSFSLAISQEDIDYEREKSAREDKKEGIPVRQFADDYLETLAVYRKIAEGLLEHDVLLFHGSAVAVDSEAYLFTAKSGTGKSTHTRLWREIFGGRAVMVNDDKPLLKITDDGVTVYGTPWDGKHRLSNRIAVPLRALCILERSETNRIERTTPKDAWPMLMQQSYRPQEPVKMAKTLELIDKLAQHVGLYRMGCNMESAAALMAYEAMRQR